MKNNCHACHILSALNPAPATPPSTSTHAPPLYSQSPQLLITLSCHLPSLLISRSPAPVNHTQTSTPTISFIPPRHPLLLSPSFLGCRLQVHREFSLVCSAPLRSVTESWISPKLYPEFCSEIFLVNIEISYVRVFPACFGFCIISSIVVQSERWSVSLPCFPFPFPWLCFK